MPSFFSGYTSKPKKVSSGAQKKAPGTGFYFKDSEPNQFYYFKRTGNPDFQGDDIAETIFSGLAKAVLPKDKADLIAECEPCATAENSEIEKAVFVKSKCSDGFNELYKHKFGTNFYLDYAREALYSKEKTKKFEIYASLDDKQKKQLADILATSLLLCEYDCNTQNIGIDKKGNLIKIDHGWGFAGICKDKHKVVRLFEKKDMYSKRAGNVRPSPTNHFNDYVYTVNSKEFINSINSLIKNIETNKINFKDTINAELNKIEIEYGKISTSDDESQKKKQQVLLHFAKHVGLDTKNIESKNNEELREFVLKNIDVALNERVNSLKIVQSLLEYKMQLKDTKNISDAEYIILAQNFKRRLEQANYTQRNIDDILPEFGKTLLTQIFDNLHRIEIESSKSNPEQFLKIHNLIEFYKPAFKNSTTFKNYLIKDEALMQQPKSQYSLMEHRKTKQHQVKTKQHQVKTKQHQVKTKQHNVTKQTLNSAIKSTLDFNDMSLELQKNMPNITYEIVENKVSILENKQPKVEISQVDDEQRISTTNNTADQTQIEIVARWILQSKDPSPKIDSGKPQDVINLLTKIKELNTNEQLTPDISSKILTAANNTERTQLETILKEFSKEPLIVKTKKLE